MKLSDQLNAQRDVTAMSTLRMTYDTDGKIHVEFSDIGRLVASPQADATDEDSLRTIKMLTQILKIPGVMGAGVEMRDGSCVVIVDCNGVDQTAEAEIGKRLRQPLVSAAGVVRVLPTFWQVEPTTS